MSQSTKSRDQIRGEQYKRFQGYIYQELMTAERWSTYCPCSYTWLCEFESNQHLFTIIKYLIKQQNIDIDSITSSNVKDVLSTISQEEFVLCLVHINKFGSLKGYLSDNSSLSNRSDEQECVSSVGDSGSDQVESQTVSSETESSYDIVSLCSDVGKQEPSGGSNDFVNVELETQDFSVKSEEYNFSRTESLQISMMNQYNSGVMPYVVIANHKICSYLEKNSPHPVRSFDKVLVDYSPVTVSSDASIARCGRNRLLVTADEKMHGIRNSGLLRYYDHEKVLMLSDGKFINEDGSTENFLNKWIKGHHFEVVDGDLKPVTNSRSCVAALSRSNRTGIRKRQRERHKSRVEMWNARRSGVNADHADRSHSC